MAEIGFPKCLTVPRGICNIGRIAFLPVSQQTIGESILSPSNRRPWLPHAIDALLTVSFFLIGFFSASGDAAADRDRIQKTGTPMKHIIVLVEAS